MVSDRVGKSYYFFPLILALLALILIGIGAEILVIFGAKDFFLYLLYFPVAEEGLKFFTQSRMRLLVFRVIVYYAILELVIAKAPAILWEEGGATFYHVTLALTAFSLHLATAYVYKSDIFAIRRYTMFFFMVLCHALFNIMDTLRLSDTYLLIASAIFSFVPYLVLFIFQKVLLVRQ